MAGRSLAIPELISRFEVTVSRMTGPKPRITDRPGEFSTVLSTRPRSVASAVGCRSARTTR